jgi:hypothetical protein
MAGDRREQNHRDFPYESDSAHQAQEWCKDPHVLGPVESP